jgi:Mg/Co/Ni transporter MgtE
MEELDMVVQWRYKRNNEEMTTWMELEFIDTTRKMTMEQAQEMMRNAMGRIWPILGSGVTYEIREIDQRF